MKAGPLFLAIYDQSMPMNSAIPAQINDLFRSYPPPVCEHLLAVRTLIYDMAAEHELGKVDEAIKWGEASFLVKGGTAVRVDWKEKRPEVVKVFFHCQTRLIETFREVYPDVFAYEGNRALLIPLADYSKQSELAHCLSVAMRYQALKRLPMLGM
ncbi:DUF1801 domain-containing protein [Gilvimarinus chinensis]|uniref:DUF1801 domain-containing protein n=1 Tax=Gilvimarinus chinensis TaxID=396005 RepID=UPI00035E4B53|nr:DUF1801 domain-containing protein [Gilvimarinus chinensis]